MIDYVYCVEKSGGNRQKITEIILAANASQNTNQTGGSLSVSGANKVVKGSAKLALSHELSQAEENNAAKIIQTTYFPGGMESCQKFYDQIIDKKARKDASKALKVSAELLKKTEHRHLSSIQRDSFTSHFVQAQKDSIGIFVGDRAQETITYAKEIKSLLKETGFDIENGINDSEHNENITKISGVIEAEPELGHIAIILDMNNPPPYAESIRQAFHKIGIEADLVDMQQKHMKYFKARALIYVGGKQ